jgi:aminopeptidase
MEADFLRILVDAVHDAGGIPFVSIVDRRMDRAIYSRAPEEFFELQARFEVERMKMMNVFIGFSSQRNQYSWSDIPEDKLELYNRHIWKKVHIEQRLPHTRWVVLRYPSAALAMSARMSEDAFEDFYFDVCTMDYAKMSRAMDSLVQIMERTDRVRIVSPGTDLSFSIAGLPAIKCDGTMNIPDGEVYTAPVRDSVEGRISYNTPSEKDGFVFENVVLDFKKGRIVAASANDSQRINGILDIDEGARFVGEFAIGVNPYINSPMLETLFDEKIAGSIHFTPGNAYDDCFNGNRSALHWDMVLIQRPEYGGGQMWFDGKLVRENGRFVIPELECLNPENLK